MRTEPTLRIPFGILLLLLALGLYALGVAWLAQWIERLPIWAQTGVYLGLGIIWIFPARRLLVWMQTGRFR